MKDHQELTSFSSNGRKASQILLLWSSYLVFMFNIYPVASFYWKLEIDMKRQYLVFENGILCVYMLLKPDVYTQFISKQFIIRIMKCLPSSLLLQQSLTWTSSLASHPLTNVFCPKMQLISMCQIILLHPISITSVFVVGYYPWEQYWCIKNFSKIFQWFCS